MEIGSKDHAQVTGFFLIHLSFLCAYGSRSQQRRRLTLRYTHIHTCMQHLSSAFIRWTTEPIRNLEYVMSILPVERTADVESALLSKVLS